MAPKVSLKYLSVNDYEKFQEALNDDWESHFEFVHYWNTLVNRDFETYIKMAPDFSKGKWIPKEHVPCTFLFAFNEEKEVVGRVSFRHELNDHLLKVGGHIGYGVCPKKRRRGYATSILRESLNYVKLNFPKINKVLVTCSEGNIGSVKTIERNGGILENSIEISDGTKKLRYWISL